MHPISNNPSSSNRNASSPQPNSRIDADGMVQPSARLAAAMDQSGAFSAAVAMDQMYIGRRDARTAARAQALENISDFFHMQMNPKPNSAYLAQSGVGQATSQDLIALRRQNSFVAIAAQLADVEALAFTPQGEPDAYLDSNTSDVLEQSVMTVQLLAGAVQEAAMERAKVGERALPLTLDTPRMRAFLADNEAALTSVIQACPGGVGNAERLAGPVRTLATEYLRRNGLIPSGLPSHMHE